MPPLSLNAKRLKLKAKNLLLVSCLLLLVSLLSGCNLIGVNKPAALQVTSTPEASVFLDGKHLGKTPFYSDQLKSGQYTVKVTASDATYVDKITLTAGTLTVVNRDLASNFLAQAGENLSLVPGEKGLFVISWPTDADITIDGQYIGKTPFIVPEPTEAEHKVLITKTGFANREFTIKSSSKYQLSAEVTLASQVAKGTVAKSTQPEETQAKKVQVIATPQGYLRIRRDPDLSSPEVGRVNTDDTLEVIQEAKDWLQVKFSISAKDAGKLGWISAQYTKKLP